MGKRDDRLHSPQVFQQALMTRPVAKIGSCVVYKIPSSEGMRLGFVLPKKTDSICRAAKSDQTLGSGVVSSSDLDDRPGICTGIAGQCTGPESPVVF